jgi:hypothetical protein
VPTYVLRINAEKSGHQLPNGANAAVVYAPDPTVAKAILAAQFDGDGAAWEVDGDATEAGPASSWQGWKFDLTIHGGLGVGGQEPLTVSFTADGVDNTLDLIGAQLVTQLNAHPDIAGASYDGPTNVLTVADAGDGLGDQTVSVMMTPPFAVSSFPGPVGITHQGAAGDPLFVAFPPDATDTDVPQILGIFAQV